MTDLMRSLFFVDKSPIPERSEKDSQAIVASKRSRALASSVHMLEGLRMPSRPKHPSLVSSCLGRITRVLLTMPDYVFEDSYYLEVYRTLIQHLGTGTRFVVAVHERYAERIEALLRESGLKTNPDIVAISDSIHFSVWAEDAYVCSIDKQTGATYLLEPFSFTRLGDMIIADAIKEVTDVRNYQTILTFQGGNCLIGDRFWLIGNDYIEDTLWSFQDNDSPYLPKNKAKKDTNIDDVIQAFKDFVDSERRLIPVGTTKHVIGSVPLATKEDGQIYLNFVRGTGYGQPIFHIDMFITLIGPGPDNRFRLMVGSPQMAAELTGRPFNPLLSMQAAFNEIAGTLEQQGFDVHRNPLPHVFYQGGDRTFKEVKDEAATLPVGNTRRGWEALIDELTQLGAENSTLLSGRQWYFATANNCLVQTVTPGENYVILPTYAHGDYAWLKPVDEKNKQLWSCMNYEVKELPDFHPFAQRSGSVHCIKKYLGRDTPVSSMTA